MIQGIVYGLIAQKWRCYVVILLTVLSENLKPPTTVYSEIVLSISYMWRTHITHMHVCGAEVTEEPSGLGRILIRVYSGVRLAFKC